MWFRILMVGAAAFAVACSEPQPPAQDDVQPEDAAETSDVEPDAPEGTDAGVDTGVDSPDPDRDGDGVSNEDELAAGTDPDLEDSDGDGFWDGWEQAAGTDPLDPTDTPTFELPAGTPYLLRLDDIVEPSLLRPLLSGRLRSIPPILVFVDGLTDGEGDVVSLQGGIGEFVGNGADEIKGTSDDLYGMRFSSISQLDGRFLINFEGRVDGQELRATAARIALDLTGVSEITDGVTLRVEDVTLGAALVEALEVMDSGGLEGVFTRDGVAELASQFSDVIPVDPDLIVDQLDSDADGLIPVHFTFSGRRCVVEGFSAPAREVEAPPRSPGRCCPQGAQVGQSVEPYLVMGAGEQGISPDEEALAQRAIAALSADPEVQFVTTVRVLDGRFHYFVYGADGSIEFLRERSAQGTSYPIVAQEGSNPLANVDPARWGTLSQLLELEANPESTVYPEQGYFEPSDERLYFVEPDQMSFPFAFERIAALYDDPRAGDLTVTEVSYTGGGLSSHGQLGALQSRSPLVMMGPGIRSAADTAPGGEFVVRDFEGDAADPQRRAMLFAQRAVRGVDIAPTVAAALGVAPHGLGVLDGRFSAEALLAWQDGRVLEEVFTEDALERIGRNEAVARYAVIVINDGLTAVEINHEVTSPGFDVAAYRGLFSAGLAFEFGSITNWPSNTFPGHNMVGMGAYSGHHGILDNSFYERSVGRSFSPLSDLFETERFIGSAHANLPVETLFEAVHRTFGAWDGTPDGVFTASFNDPTTRGATFATLERRKPEVLEAPTPGQAIEIGPRVFDLPAADASDFEGLVDNATVFNLKSVYLSQTVPKPRLGIVNFSATDGGGHAHGPHGDFEREVVIPRTSERIGILLAILEEAGILDETLVVLTSDHGMELKDSSRRGSTTDRLSAEGIRFVKVGNNLVFKRLAVEVEGGDDLTPGEPAQILLTVLDRHTVDGPERVPIAGATVRVISGAEEVSAVTDASGTLEMELRPAQGAQAVELLVEHADYNAEALELSLQ